MATSWANRGRLHDQILSADAVQGSIEVPQLEDDVSPQRSFGLEANSFGSVAWTTDDLELLDRSMAQRDFRAVYVGLVVHDPDVVTKTLDTARWALELLTTCQASVFALVPLGRLDTPAPLSVRQWNHAVATVEYLRRECEQRGLIFECFEDLNEAPVDPVLPLAGFPVVGIDPRGALDEGWRPVRLVSPDLI